VGPTSRVKKTHLLSPEDAIFEELLFFDNYAENQAQMTVYLQVRRSAKALQF